MKDLMQNGRLIEIILVLMVLEAVVLIAWYKLKGHGVAPVSLIVNLLAGVFLMLAVLGALQNASSVTLGTCLLAALLAHIGDLAMRWSDHGKANSSLGRIVATRHRLFERSL